MIFSSMLIACCSAWRVVSMRPIGYRVEVSGSLCARFILLLVSIVPYTLLTMLTSTVSISLHLAYDCDIFIFRLRHGA